MRVLTRPGSRLAIAICLLGSLVFMQAASADAGGPEGGDDKNTDREHDYAEKLSTYSSPVALSKDNMTLWVVNPDTDSVSVVRTDTHKVIAHIKTGDEPRSIALTPDGKYAYVANASGNSVTVIKIRSGTPDRFKASLDRRVGRHGNFITGAAPQSIIVTPNGRRVFVANSVQDTITVIDANSRKMIGSVDLRNSLCNIGDTRRHFQPRGMAVTQDSKYLYVTRFLSYTHNNGVQREDVTIQPILPRSAASGLIHFHKIRILALEKQCQCLRSRHALLATS